MKRFARALILNVISKDLWFGSFEPIDECQASRRGVPNSKCLQHNVLG